MTVITHNKRRSRLTKLIDQPGGISVGVAIAQAQANLQALQEKSLSVIAHHINELSALVPAEGDQAAYRLEQAYQASSAVIDAAGPFNMTDLCSAAAGLCDLIDAASKDRPFDWRIVTVHAQAMRLLMSLPADQHAARTQVLDSLKDVLRHKLPSEPRAAG